jgi:hypothetical protein
MVPPLCGTYEKRRAPRKRVEMKLVEETRRNETEARQNLNPAARRALAEAQERRRMAAADSRPIEVGGRKGPDPVRYGDWEVKGIASDF